MFHWPVVFGFYLMGQIVYWYSPCPVNIIPSLLDERVLYSVQRTLWTMTLKLWIMTLEWTSKGSHTPPLPSPPVDPVNNMSHYGLNQPMVHTHMYRSAEQQSVAADPVNTIRVSLARRRSRCPAFASAEQLCGGDSPPLERERSRRNCSVVTVSPGHSCHSFAPDDHPPVTPASTPCQPTAGMKKYSITSSSSLVVVPLAIKWIQFSKLFSNCFSHSIFTVRPHQSSPQIPVNNCDNLLSTHCWPMKKFSV